MEKSVVLNLQVVTPDDGAVTSLASDLNSVANEIELLNDADLSQLEQSMAELDDLVKDVSLSYSEVADAAEAYRKIAERAGETSPIGAEAARNAKELESKIMGAEDALNDLEKQLRNVRNADAVEVTSKAFQDLDRIVDDNALSIQDLTKAAENYLNIAAVAGRDTVIGQEAIQRAGELQDQVSGLQTELANASMDASNFQAALQLGQGVTAAYGAFASVTALVGEENEDLMKVMVKLQAVQGALASIEQVRLALEKESIIVTKARTLWTNLQTAATEGSTVATRVLNVVMNLNPAILIAAGIGVLVGAVTALAVAMKGASKEQQALNDVQNESASAIAEERANMDQLIGTIKRETASREDKAAAIEQLQNDYPEYLANISEEGILTGEMNDLIVNQTKLIDARAKAQAAANLKAEAYEELVKAQIEAENDREPGFLAYTAAVITAGDAQEYQNNMINNNLREAQEQIDAISAVEEKFASEADTLAANSAEIEKNTFARAANAAAANTFTQEDVDKIMKARKKLADEALKRRRLLEDIEASLIEDSLERELQQRALAFERRMAQLKEQGVLTIELRERLELQEAEAIQNIRDEVAREEAQKALERANALANARIDIMEQGLEKELAAEEQAFKERREQAVAEGLLSNEELQKMEEQHEAALSDIRLKFINMDLDRLRAKEEFQISLMQEGLEKELAAQRLAQEAEREMLIEEGLLTEETLKALEERQQAELEAIRKRWRDKRREDIVNGLSDAAGALDGLSQLNDAVLERQLQKAEGNEAKQEALRKRAFERNKKLQAANALINGAQAVLVALSSTPPPFNFIAAGLAGTIAAVQAATIASAKYESAGAGAGVGSSGFSTPSIPSGGGSDPTSGNTAPGGGPNSGVVDPTSLPGGGGQVRVAVSAIEIQDTLDANTQVAELSEI